jgi:hypothetical protein
MTFASKKHPSRKRCFPPKCCPAYLAFSALLTRGASTCPREAQKHRQVVDSATGPAIRRTARHHRRHHRRHQQHHHHPLPPPSSSPAIRARRFDSEVPVLRPLIHTIVCTSSPMIRRSHVPGMGLWPPVYTGIYRVRVLVLNTRNKIPAAIRLRGMHRAGMRGWR